MSEARTGDEEERPWEPILHPIPSSWERVPFADAFVAVSTDGKKVPAKEYLQEGDLSVIDQGQAFIGGYTNDVSRAIDPGEDGVIVFGDHTRVFKRVRFPFAPGADGVKILRPTLSGSAYAHYACMSLQFPNKGYSRHYSHLVRCSLPIAPEPEQQRIVSKIDELFSRVEEGERALKRVQMLVERYRQSVLKAAVTGDLTREWREQRKDQLESGEALLERILQARREAWEQTELDKMQARSITPADDNWKSKYKEPSPPDTTELPELPEGWAWASVEQLCSEFGNGLSRKPANQPPGLPILRISAVRPIAVDHSDIRYYVPEDHEALDSFKVIHGDLLFTRYNGSKQLVGSSGVFKGSTPTLHPDKLIKARVVAPKLLSPDYLAACLNAGESWRHITGCVKTSAGQHGIAGSDIKRTPVPVPPHLEQIRIIDLAESALSKCAAAASSCGEQVRWSMALRQATLKSAFTGNLVPQSLTDEPASALLNRIAAERATSTPAPKRGSRKHARTG